MLSADEFSSGADYVTRVVFLLLWSLAVHILSTLLPPPPHLSSYLLTPYYSGWRPQDLMESVRARVCERGRVKTRQPLILF